MCWKHKFASLCLHLFHCVATSDYNGMRPVFISDLLLNSSVFLQIPRLCHFFVECLIFLMALCCSSSLKSAFFLFFPPADIISTVEFNHTGELLATGDKGGRVVIFQREPEVCELPM